MSKLIFYIRAVLIHSIMLMTMAGCTKQLNQQPETTIAEDKYWKTISDLKLGANYFYTFLPGIENCLTDNWTNDAYANGTNAISDGSRLASGTDGNWNESYRLIRACNNLLEKSDGVNVLDTEKNPFRAEARFFRAWANFTLVSRYGEVPLITKTFEIDAPQIKATRTKREIIFDSIYADLDWAAANLPHIDALSDGDYGRISKTAAMAFKARVALFEGTRQKFHSYGVPSKHLQIAVDASEAVIVSGKHRLFVYPLATMPDSSYYYNFQYAGEGYKLNKENMMVRLYGANASNRISTHSFVRNLEQGFTTPTRTLADAYLYKDGLPYTKSAYDSTSPAKQLRSLSEFSNRDYRMTQTFFTRNSFFITKNYQLTYQFSPSGYKEMKYFIAADWNPNVSFIDYQIIRYAEVLLINIEAKFELTGSVTDADLNKTINQTRARAGLPPLSGGFLESNGLNLREEIRRERRVEFAFEGLRYWDLIRWKTAEIELPQTILGAKNFQDEYQKLPSNAKLDSHGFVILQAADRRKFNPAKDYLFPIPTQELGLNPSLQPQNPGW